MRILTEEMVLTAIELVRPSIEKMFEAKDLIWGPKWVEICIKIPGRQEPIITRVGDSSQVWKPEWKGSDKFAEIARKKMEIADREKKNTSVITYGCSWVLLSEDYLYFGGAHRDGISVGVSGAFGRVDEAIAMMIIDIIVMFAQLETDRRILANKTQI